MAGRKQIALAAAASSLVLTAAGCGGGEGGGGGTGSDSEEAVTLRFADLLPPNHYIAEGLVQPLVEKVGSISEDEGCPVEADLFPDGQLGEAADMVTNLQSGVFEMAHVAPPYNGEQMPLGNAFNLPQMAPNATVLGHAYYDAVRDEDSVFYQHDFERNEIVPLAAYALPLYQFATSKPIDGVDALRGLNIRSGGGAQDDVVTALGATPVHLTTPEQYEGLQRGIIDGGIFNLPSMISNRTYEVTTHFTTNADVASFNGAIAVSQSAWEGLSECQQNALVQAGEQASADFADSLPEIVEENVAQLESEGLTAVEFGEAELSELSDMLAGVADSWIEDLPAQAPGDAALEEAKAAVEDQS